MCEYTWFIHVRQQALPTSTNLLTPLNNLFTYLPEVVQLRLRRPQPLAVPTEVRIEGKKERRKEGKGKMRGVIYMLVYISVSLFTDGR